MILKLEILNREILIDTSFVLLCLSIVCLPINKEIAGPFRLTDIFLVLSVASIITKIKLSQQVFQLLVGLAVILAVSSVLGVLAYGITNLSNIGFAYKFIVPIMPVLILGTVRIGPKGIVLLHRILFYVFLFLVGWVYLYLALRLTGRINGVLRPSFPFSSDYYQSDAHLYSSYLAMCLIMYNFYWRNLFGQKYFWLIFVNLVALPAIILTGSRTGIVLVGFAQIFSSLISLKKIFYLRKSTFFIAVLFIGIGLYFMSKVSFDVATLRLIERAFEFNAGEESSGSRVRKLLLSFDQTSGTMFIFGVGLLANYVTWYDGLIGSTNGFMGIAGLVLIFVVIVQIIRLNYLNAVKNGTLSLFNPFIIVFASYLIANLITEYYLVTRGVLPTALFLMLLHIQIANSSDRQLSKTSA